MSPMAKPFLRADSITKSFATVKAVRSLTFQIERGEIFGLLGPNGAGKTSVDRMLLGIIAPDAGSIHFATDGQGQRIDPRQFGYMPEDRGLHRDIPILRTLEFFGALRGMRHADARRSALAWLERFQLEDRAGEKLEALSRGNQQKVQFITSILHEPAFAVLDEPFSGLDPVNQELFLDVLRELRVAGTTIVLSAHQMDLVQQLADHILLMDHGEAVLTGTLSEIRDRFGSKSRVDLGIDPAGDPDVLSSFPGVTEIRRDHDEVSVWLRDDSTLGDFLTFAASRLEVRSVRSAAPTLHEIFVETVQGDTTNPAQHPDQATNESGASS